MTARRDLRPGADVRGLYAALGVHLPSGAGHEATVRCFARPDEHRCGDRHPSCSVSLLSGAWCCHACGASGGAYDAALACGLTPRAAMELLIAHGLAEPRLTLRSDDGRRPRRSHAASAPARPEPAPKRLEVTDAQIARWALNLSHNQELVLRLARMRLWDPQLMTRLQIGFDGRRVTIPVRDATGRLVALLRYDAGPHRCGPKMLAAPGSRRALFPHPSTVPAEPLLLVEGHPDALAALSAGLPAVAVPGVHGWDPAWTRQLHSRCVVVCFDCDAPGRRAAQRVAEHLRHATSVLAVLDLAPSRADGFDLTDLLLAGGREYLAQLLADISDSPPATT